jgi:hypothetical protein
MSESDREFIRLLGRLHELYLSVRVDLRERAPNVDGSWRLRLAQQDDYLLAVASGRLTYQQAITQVFSLLLIANSNGLEKILVDATESEGGEMTDAERDELGMKVAQHSTSIGATTRIAVVGHPPAITGIAAAAARSYGLPCETFPSRLGALKWLAEDSRNTPVKPAVFPVKVPN